MKNTPLYLTAILSIVFLLSLLPACTKKDAGPAEITAYSRSSGRGGDTITIQGNNLPVSDTSFNVSINGNKVKIVSSDQDQIVAIVPKMAGSGSFDIAVKEQVYKGPTFTYNYLVTVTTVAGTGSEGRDDGEGYNATFKCPWGITADSNGDLYVADCYNRLIRKVSGSTGVVSTFQIPTSPNGKSFYSPYNITLDKRTGSLYLTDFNTNLMKRDASGNMDVIYQGKMPTTGIAVGPDGLLYMGNNTEGTIVKMDTTGNNVLPFASGLITPRNIIFDKEGNMYVGAYNINKITPAGVKTAIPRDPRFQGWEIARDAWGNIYEADHFNNTLSMIEASTGNILVLAGNGTAQDVNGVGLNASFNGPQGLTIDKHGNLFMTTYNYDTKGGNKIRKIVVQ